MQHIHVCGVAEADTMPGPPARWPGGMAEVTYYEALEFPGVPRDAVRRCYDEAAARWSRVCGLPLRRVDRPEDAHIVAYNGRIDGRGNVLALSDLPYNANQATVLHQTFDPAEAWDGSPQGLDQLTATMCHELGHALGLNHMPGTGALMEPYIVAGRSSPQAPDVAAIRDLYGPPTSRDGQAPTQRIEALAKSLIPYLIGTYCDGLVAAAGAMAAYPPADADDRGRGVEEQKRREAWAAVVEPTIRDWSPAGRAGFYRLLAAAVAKAAGLVAGS